MGFGSFLKKAGGFLAPVAGFALGGPLGGALGGAIGGALTRGRGGGATGGGGGGSAGDLAFRRMADEEMARGDRMSSAYETGIQGFDPRKYLKESVDAGMEGLNEQYTELEGQRAASLNRRGLFNSDIGGARGRKDLNERTSRMVASRAMEAGGMEADRLSSMGAYGERARDRAMEAQFGRYATDRESEERDRESKRSMWGSLGGAALGAAGTVLAHKYGR